MQRQAPRIDYASRRMRQRLFRSVLCAAAILVTLAMDLAPHHHDDWTEGFATALNGGEIHDADCRAPRSRAHFHADSVRHIDSCIACLRQHMQAIGRVVRVCVSQSVVARLASFTAVAHFCRVNLCKSSRAPPPAAV
jgi:hypothetical protein